MANTENLFCNDLLEVAVSALPCFGITIHSCLMTSWDINFGNNESFVFTGVSPRMEASMSSLLDKRREQQQVSLYVTKY